MAERPPRLAQRLNAFTDRAFARIFSLAQTLDDPINLCVGQPHYDVPEPLREAAVAAIRSGKNAYTLPQGLPTLRRKLLDQHRAVRPIDGLDAIVSVGTCGALTNALLATLDPGDEAILFDPYFIAYPQLIALAGATPVLVDTHPEFQIPLAAVRQAITPKTKVILVGSPANPTGAVLSRESVRGLAALADEYNLQLISDEIYATFCYDREFVSPAEANANVCVVSSFSKTHAMTGWRVGYAIGPRPLIEAMMQLQQVSTVCAPSMAQHAGIAACDFDMSSYVEQYRRKRDLLLQNLDSRFAFTVPEGAFYLYPKVPWGTGTEFMEAAVREKLLILPGSTFSARDTHFRVSYAADDRTLERGVAALNRLATRGA